ncbi:LysR substrate-binding domain-containing protein [Agrobacterium sp. MCAB5]|uniref:LysR substrate-binding domain-containing protein n=1 Tax=Agrobacterium sp. MCAB5 TaxID=3233042 RepID=UPI003F91BE59
MALYLPPTEQLLAFKLAIEHGSFTAAASELNITQSAVSHQVAKLERAVGSRLITRSARGLALTDAGETLIAAISDPISQLLSAFESLSVPSSTNLLKIQVESAFAASWLSPRLDSFLGRFPNLRLEQYRSTNLRLSDRVELAIKWGSGRWPDLVSEKLLSIYYTPVCSSAIAASGKLNNAEDLQNFTLLHDRRYKDWQQWLDQYYIHHPNVRRGHIVDDAYILSEMAMESRGIALCAPILARRELASGSLVCPFPAMRLFPKEAYYLVKRKETRLSRNAEAFAAWLKDEAAEASA